MAEKLRLLIAGKTEESMNFTNTLVTMLKKSYDGVELSQVSKRHSIMKMISQDKNFDAIILSEELNNNTIISIEFIEEMLMEVAGQKIYFIMSNLHEGDTNHLNRLLNTGINNLIFKKDCKPEVLANLIVNNYDSKIIKAYLGIESTEDINGNNMDDKNKIPFEQANAAIEYLSSYKNESDFEGRYNLISKKYSEAQRRYIFSKLPNHIRVKLLDGDNGKKSEIKTNKNKNSFTSRNKIIKKEVVRHIYNIPKDYKKIICIFGFESPGKTTIAVNLAYLLSKNGIKTTLIDTDVYKKDIYYHFNKDYSNCLNNIELPKNWRNMGQEINENLKVFSEHRDINIQGIDEEFIDLITISKKNSDIVVVDLTETLKKSVIKRILNYSDNILFVSSQNINTLHRTIVRLFEYRENLSSIELIINKFVNGVQYLKPKHISKNFFNEAKYNGEKMKINVNKVFTLGYDRDSIVKGLALREPVFEIANDELRDSIKILANYYYKHEEMSSKKVFRNFFRLK